MFPCRGQYIGPKIIFTPTPDFFLLFLVCHDKPIFHPHAPFFALFFAPYSSICFQVALSFLFLPLFYHIFPLFIFPLLIFLRGVGVIFNLTPLFRWTYMLGKLASLELSIRHSSTVRNSLTLLLFSRGTVTLLYKKLILIFHLEK